MAEDDKGPDLEAGIDASDLKDGAMIGGRFQGVGVLVARRGGKLFAVSSECTHLGGPLPDGAIVGDQVRCPWHQARFSLETGEAVAGPALQPLGCYAVEERGGKIYVTGKRAQAEPAKPAKDPGHVVIIGGGAGGHACADMLARRGVGAQVTVVMADADPPYDRTFVSKQYLSGEAKREEPNLDHNEIYKTDGVTLRTGAKVSAIDMKAKTVTLEGGESLPFDALVLATGAEPNHPNVPGFDKPNVHTLRTLKDADALIAAAGKAERVAVVGASFIGLEAAAAMIERKLIVHVIAPEEIPLARVLGDEVGRYVKGLHDKKGVVFHLGRKVERFDGAALHLDDGSKVDADFVILGMGVKPRVDLAEAVGLELRDAKDGGGVVVDGRLQTSAEGVYAVGDIAAYPDPRVGRIRVEHWVHAERQGQHVARVLMGEADAYTLAPFFWSNHYDTGQLGYIGHASKVGETMVDGDIAEGEFTVRYVEDGKVTAMTSSMRDQDALAFDAELEGAWVG